MSSGWQLALGLWISLAGLHFFAPDSDGPGRLLDDLEASAVRGGFDVSNPPPLPKESCQLEAARDACTLLYAVPCETEGTPCIWCRDVGAEFRKCVPGGPSSCPELVGDPTVPCGTKWIGICIDYGPQHGIQCHGTQSGSCGTIENQCG